MIYALEGEEVTCERGHVVARFLRDVHSGQRKTRDDLEFVDQPHPEVGDPLPICQVCGASAFRGTGHFAHFRGGWRHGGRNRAMLPEDIGLRSPGVTFEDCRFESDTGTGVWIRGR